MTEKRVLGDPTLFDCSGVIWNLLSTFLSAGAGSGEPSTDRNSYANHKPPEHKNTRLWLERLVARSRIPYPVLFGALNASLYIGGLLIAMVTGNLQAYIGQPRWVLMAVFGWLNGCAVILATRLFMNSLDSARPLLKTDPSGWKRFEQELSKTITYPFYWIPVLFWFAFSFYYDIRGSGWWNIHTTYSQPLVIATYGYIYQGISGCLLGGMLMGILPINLSIAFWKLTSQHAYYEDIITERGKSCFRPLKRLIILNTAMLVISTGVAMSLWVEILPLARSLVHSRNSSPPQSFLTTSSTDHSVRQKKRSSVS